MSKYRGPEVDTEAPRAATTVDRRARLGLWLFGATVIGLAIGTSLRFWEVVGLALFYVLLPVLGWVQLPLMRSALVERIPVYGASAVSTLMVGLVAFLLARGLEPGEGLRIGTAGLSGAELLAWTGALVGLGILLILVFEPLDRRVGSPGSEMVLQLIPRTAKERTMFAGLSLAAGFGEELAYRGYALAAVQLLIPGVWLAAAVSTAPFAFLHAYQGPVGIVRTGLIGMVLAVPVVVTGSLLPAMCAHAVIDLVAGLVIGPWLLRESGQPRASHEPSRSEPGALPSGMSMDDPAAEALTNDPHVTRRLDEIWVYPLKGAAGIRVSRWEIGELGLRHDRRWMLVDEEGKFRSQRTDPGLCRVLPRIDDGELRFEAEGVPPLTLPLVPGSGSSSTARIWSDDVDVLEPSATASRWFAEVLGAPCRLVFLPDDAARACDPRRARGSLVALADAFPFLLTSVESLADLNSRLAHPVPMNRFRPNLVVHAGAPYAEDGWTRLRIGDVSFRVVKPCARCVVTTVDQTSGIKGVEPLRTLTAYRKGDEGVIFGQNLVHVDGGTIHAKARVEVLEPRRNLSQDDEVW